jgi:hypothetical protein
VNDILIRRNGKGSTGSTRRGAPAGVSAWNR